MPTAEFTVQFLKGLRAEEKAIDLFDKKVIGFGLRVAPSGNKSYSYRYRNKNGRIRKISLGCFTQISLADARAKAKEFAVCVQNGIDPLEERNQHRAAETVQEAVEQFIVFAQDNTRPNTSREYARSLRREFVPVLGKWKLGDIRRKDIIYLLERVKSRKYGDKSGAPAAANRLQQIISRFFEFCVNRDLIQVNPIYRLSKLSKEVPRNRFLSDEETKNFLVELDKTEDRLTGIAFHLTLMLARRRNEILGWRWNEIEGGIWTLPAERSKSKRSVVLPLPHQAIALLEEIKKVPCADLDGYIFPSPTKNNAHYAEPKKAFRRIRQNLDCKHFTLHDLRRTAATRMRTLGINRDDIEAVLGHAQGRLVETYQCEHPIERTRSALQQWADHLDKLQNTDNAKGGKVIHLPFRNRSKENKQWNSSSQ